jgi:hypothetical protein
MRWSAAQLHQLGSAPDGSMELNYLTPIELQWELVLPEGMGTSANALSFTRKPMLIVARME